MVYSLEAVEVVLTRRRIQLPATEAAARLRAFEVLLREDWLQAHSFRLGHTYQEFTDEEWRDVIRVSGEKAVRNDLRALTICARQGILVCPELHLGGSSCDTVEQS